MAVRKTPYAKGRSRLTEQGAYVRETAAEVAAAAAVQAEHEARQAQVAQVARDAAREAARAGAVDALVAELAARGEALSPEFAALVEALGSSPLGGGREGAAFQAAPGAGGGEGVMQGEAPNGETPK